MSFGKDKFVLNSRSGNQRKFGAYLPIKRHSESQSVETVFGLEGLLALRNDWENLVASDPSSSPYASWLWMSSWIEAYGLNREFLTFVVYKGYEIVGIVPFSWKKQATPLELRKLWMLGFHSWTGINGLTEEPIFAMTPNLEIRDRVWPLVHEELRRVIENGRWDSAAYRKFGHGIEGGSFLQQNESCTEVQDFRRGCEYVELPETWELYLKSISKSMRENIPYYHKKFEKEGIGYSIQTTPADELQEAINRLIHLHKKRTYTDASLQHVDYFGDRRQQVLLRIVVSRMVEANEAKLVTLKANGKVIAAQVFLKNHNQLLAHYSGFDPDWSKFSPLFVLQTQVIKDAIDEGYETLNLLRGNANWQRRWGANSRNQIVDVTIGRRKFIPRVRQVLRHREGMVIHTVTNAPSVRKLRASYRSWQLGLKSA